MYDTIVNPITGRKVSIYGRIGKNILKNYIKQIGGHDGPCSLNLETGRCKSQPGHHLVDDNRCKLDKHTGRCVRKKRVCVKYGYK